MRWEAKRTSLIFQAMNIVLTFSLVGRCPCNLCNFDDIDYGLQGTCLQPSSVKFSAFPWISSILSLDQSMESDEKIPSELVVNLFSLIFRHLMVLQLGIRCCNHFHILSAKTKLDVSYRRIQWFGLRGDAVYLLGATQASHSLQSAPFIYLIPSSPVLQVLSNHIITFYTILCAKSNVV